MYKQAATQTHRSDATFAATWRRVFCHACHPLLGAAVFNWTDQQWQVESKNLLLGWGNSFDESFKLVKLALTAMLFWIA